MTQQKQDPNLVNLTLTQLELEPKVSPVLAPELALAPEPAKKADKSKRAENLRANMLKRKQQMAARAKEQG